MTSVFRGFRSSGLGFLLALTACVSTPPKPADVQTPEPATPVAPLAEAPSGPASPDPPAAVDTAGATTSPTPPCSCLEAKAKPKPRTKPKVVRREAPPQLPTAPVVEETPPGKLIDAQVRSMSVSVMSILGKRVRGANGEDLGRVVDVLTDASGRVRTAIIDFGGFLGVGNHRVAVDWPLLRFNPDGADPSLLLSLSPEKLRTAPEYKDNPRPQILMVPTATTAAPAG